MSGVIFSRPSMWKIMKILLGPCCTKCYQYIANFGTENAVKAWLQSSRKKHRSLRWCWIAARITNIGRKYDCPVSTTRNLFSITRMRILQASTCPFLFVACTWLQGLARWQIWHQKKGRISWRSSWWDEWFFGPWELKFPMVSYFIEDLHL